MLYECWESALNSRYQWHEKSKCSSEKSIVMTISSINATNGVSTFQTLGKIYSAKDNIKRGTRFHIPNRFQAITTSVCNISIGRDMCYTLTVHTVNK